MSATEGNIGYVEWLQSEGILSNEDFKRSQELILEKLHIDEYVYKIDYDEYLIEQHKLEKRFSKRDINSNSTGKAKQAFKCNKKLPNEYWGSSFNSKHFTKANKQQRRK